jgi:rod shape-determining protein MreD
VTARSLIRLVLVITLLLLVQSTIGLDLRLAGAHPDLMFLLPIAAALAAGPEEGAMVGFLAGLGADLLLPTPFGLSALVGCMLGFAVGRVTQATDRTIWWLTPLVALTGSAVAVMLYAVLGAVLGQDEMLKVDLLSIVTVVSVINALLAAPVTRLVAWALGEGTIARKRTLATGARW